MGRSIASKAMWVGRTTAAVIGLAVALALVFGVATTALAALPGDPFRLGQTNGIDAMSALVGNVAGPMLRVDNNSTGTGATALDLRVEAGKPPMKVNSSTRVANLNADKLDGKDSTTLPVTTKTNVEAITNCIPIGSDIDSFKDCAPITVTVPPGKQYHVTVLSSFSIKIGSSGSAIYCPRIKGGSIAPPSGGCVSIGSTPDAHFYERISLAANYAESAASSGEIEPLPSGTYTFSTGIETPDWPVSSPEYNARTTVMVRDVSAPGPSIN